MKQLSLGLFVVSVSLVSMGVRAMPSSLEKVLMRIDEENPEVYASRLETQYKFQNLRGAKSRLYPSLSLSGVARESSDGAFSDPASLDTGISSPSGGLGNQGTSSLSNLNETTGSGWSGQTSMSYLVFTGYAVTEDIKRAENELSAAKVSHEVVKEQKRSQFLSLLLEWQNLKKIEPVVDEAVKLSAGVKSHRRKGSEFLYTTSDRVNLSEKVASLDYNQVRVKEGLVLVESALLKLLPSLSVRELSELPKITVQYPLPKAEEILDRYKNQSRSHLNNRLTLSSARGYQRASEWSRPWVPYITWSASYSYSGDYDGETFDNGASTSVLLNFNLFDGFYSQARLQQSRIAVEAARTKMNIEQDKRVLYLMHTRMKANVSRAKYGLKKAQAQKVRLKYLDIQKKFKQGIATHLELSGGSLQYSQAELEALDVQKEYQQAMLDIAVELNEWDKVKVNEQDQ